MYSGIPISLSAVARSYSCSTEYNADRVSLSDFATGSAVGSNVGWIDGFTVGSSVGMTGSAVGYDVGLVVGSLVGLAVVGFPVVIDGLITMADVVQQNSSWST